MKEIIIAQYKTVSLRNEHFTVSAHDCGSGLIANAEFAKELLGTKSINHFLVSFGAAITLVLKCLPFAVEFIVVQI